METATIHVFATILTGLATGCVNSEANEELPKATYNMDMENPKGEKVSMGKFKCKVILRMSGLPSVRYALKECPIQNLYKPYLI